MQKRARYEICTPKIAKDFLDKLSKLEGEDASSDEAKEVLKFKDQLKTASEGEGGDLEIFEQLQSWEESVKEGTLEAREIEGMVEYVEKKWVPDPKMSKIAAAVLEKAKPMVQAAKKAETRSNLGSSVR